MKSTKLDHAWGILIIVFLTLLLLLLAYDLYWMYFR